MATAPARVAEVAVLRTVRCVAMEAMALTLSMMLTSVKTPREDDAQTGATTEATTHARARPMAPHSTEVTAPEVHSAKIRTLPRRAMITGSRTVLSNGARTRTTASSTSSTSYRPAPRTTTEGRWDTM